MNLRRLTGRAAAAGAVSALAAGALVGISTSAAQAAGPAGVGYICHNAAFNADVPVLVGATGFPSQLTAGKPVPAGAVPVSFTLTREVLDGMAAKGIKDVGVSSNELALAIGSTSVGMTGVNVAKAPAPATGDMVMTAASQNAQFVAPAAGTYDLQLPSVFKATVDTNLAPLAVDCTIVDPSTAKIASVTSTAPVGPQGEGYTCTVFGNALPIFVEGVAPTLTSPTAGQKVAAKTVPVAATVTLAAEVADTLKEQTGATAVGFDSSDYAIGLGSSSIPANGLTASKVTIPGGADVVMPGSGTNGAFTLPSAGTYSYKLPATFNVNLQLENGIVPTLSGPCALNEGGNADLGSVDVAKATKVDSSTKVKAPSSVKQGKTVKLSVTVTAEETPSGKVTAKEGSKKLGSASLKNGKATISVKGLKPGTHKIKVSYAGDDATNASTSKTVKVKVTKKK